MASSATGWKKNSFILQELVARDFKLKYRRSVLGVLWSVLNPLLMMIVISVFMSYMFRFDVLNYPLYLILGQILFNFMVGATTSGLESIISSAALIKKIRIEKMLFPIQKVLFELINLGFAVIAVIAVMIYSKVMPTWNLLLTPILLFYLILFCTGISLALAALSVFFRDMRHLWGVFTLMWTYATPIFYPVSILEPQIRQLMNFNPMYHYVTYFRDIAMNNITPDWKANLICLGCGAVAMAIGVAIFRSSQRKFILYV